MTKATSGAATDPDAPVVFSANRTPTDIAKVGSSVSVITEKGIEAQGKTFLQDYLIQVPGVSITSTGGYGKQTTFRLRGFGREYVKYLVDGMDMSDPSNSQTAAHFEHLLVGDVAQVEVLKGSQSTLYGGDALAGVISVDTKYATRPGFFQSGSAEYGTYNTWRGSYTAGYGALNGSNIALSIQGLDTDAFSAGNKGTEDDPYRNVTLSGRGELKVSEAVTVFFAARSLDARVHYDGSAPFDSFELTDTEQHAGRVGANVTLFNGAFVNTFAVQGMEVRRDNPGAYWYEGDRTKAEYRGVLSFNKHLAVVAGVDWEETGVVTDQISRQSARVTSPYAQVIVEPLDGMVLTAGARIDDHSTFGAHDTHRLTASYLLPGTETRFHASYGTGFRAPSLYELYSPDYGNAALTPETSDSWDVGVEQGFMRGRFSVGATYYEIDMTDKISWVSLPCPCPPWGGQYQQTPGLTQSRGVELTALAQLTPNAVMNAAYTYQETEAPDGSRGLRTPRHSLVLGLTAQPMDKVSVNVTGQYIADVLDNNWSVGRVQKLDDYFLLSAKVGYEVLPGAVAYVRGDNLLDQDYTTAFDYANPGLTVFGGVQFALPAN